MKRQTRPPATVEIDASYEQRVNALESMTPGHTSDYALEPSRQPIVQRQTYVQAQPNSSEVAHRLIAAATQPLSTGDLDTVFNPMAGTHDATNARDRAAALNTKMAWQAAMLGGAGLAIIIVCVTVGFWVDRPNVGFFLGAVGALTFVYFVGSRRLNQMVANDNEYSREGTERHRIDVGADVYKTRLQHETELRRMGLAAVLKQLGVTDDRY